MVKTRLPPHVQYACLKWLYHIGRSGPNIYYAPQINTMLETKGQAWIDAITCMRQSLNTFCEFHDNYIGLGLLLDRVVNAQEDGVKVKLQS